MTAKRFTYDKPMVAFAKAGLNDNLTGKTYEFTVDEILDLLNELHEENQRLQLELDKDILFTPSRHSKTVRMDFLERYTELLNYETKVKEALQKHYHLTKDYHVAMILEALAMELGVNLND